jgi:hypothetical protein
VGLIFNRENKEELQGILAKIKISTRFYACLKGILATLLIFI